MRQSNHSFSNKKKIIGLTGGIGSGKSVAAKILEQLGAYIIDADIVARQITAPNSIGAKEIEREFGSSFFVDGMLDRRALREYVFGCAQRVARLNNIMLDLIKAELISAIQSAPNDKIIIVVIPLLQEAGWESMFDEVWAIAADFDTRIKRVEVRDNISGENTRAVIESQLRDEDRAGVKLIDNNKTLKELEDSLTAEFKRVCH